jgi:lysophospholipase L1-like esterase
MKLFAQFLVAAFVVSMAMGQSLAAPLTPDDVKLDGMKVTIVPGKQTLDIEPLVVEKAEANVDLKAGKPGWNGPVFLPNVAWVFRAMTPGSLVVTADGKPDAKLVEGKDYLLDPDWATLGAPEGGEYAGKKVHCAYTWTASRFDLVEQTADGKVALKKGVTDAKGEPHLPEFTPGSTPILSVYLAPCTSKLTMANINLIDLKTAMEPPVSGTETLKALKDKLASGKGVTIAFLGDSITAQMPKDFRDGKGSFVDRFAKYMETKYPDSKVVVTPMGTVVPPADKQIVIVKAGVGGDDTPRALKRMDKDVLAHKPDAVVVMLGVNDENGRPGKNGVPVPAYKKNLETIVDKIQAAGGTIILMTTSMKNLGWIGCAGNLNEYAAAAREVAAAKKTCLVDNFKSWELLPKRGYNYMVFLGTCINHPVDLGHELFFQNLKAAFEK